MMLYFNIIVVQFLTCKNAKLPQENKKVIDSYLACRRFSEGRRFSKKTCLPFWEESSLCNRERTAEMIESADTIVMFLEEIKD